MGKVLDWLDERTSIRALWRWTAEEPVPGGARMRYVFGSVLLYLFMQQVVIGILLMTYYSPSATDAWASVAYIQDQVSGGWFLRGLHHHGSSAMVVVMVLHVFQVVFDGAYRKPREVNWWIGLLMAHLVLAFALTGYLLPWDQKGYWATQVATGIVGTVPGGEPIRTLLQGGSEYGNLTITRFYTLHVIVLPLGLATLAFLHVALFRKHGVTVPAKVEERGVDRVDHFIPHQLFFDMLAMAVMASVLVWATYHTHGAELFAPAQPASNFVARPEWYFLFLFQILKYFEGPLQIIGTVILPGAVITGLVALPFLDRAQSRRASKRMPVLLGVGTVFATVLALTGAAVVEDRNNEEFQEGLAEARKEAEIARKWALEGVLPPGGDAVYLNDPQVQVKMLFKEHCNECHRLNDIGGGEAPELTDYSSRAWLAGLIRDPNDDKYFGLTDHEDMEANPGLSDDQLRALAEYVASLMGEEAGAVDQALAKRGAELFDDAELFEESECSSCHEVEPGEEGDGPNLHGHGTRAWIARMIRDSSQPDLFGEAADMPKFGPDKLSDEQVELLAEFIASQREPKPEDGEAGAD